MNLTDVELTQAELDQFGWQIMIDGFGIESQKKLKQATALVTRVGGLGGPVALYLALAGIGKLVLAHGDTPVMGMMNRMIMANYDTVGKVSPAVTAVDKIKALVPSVEIEVVVENVTEDNVERLVSGVDIVMDCPPWFEERHMLNRECVKQGKPMIEAAVYGMEGYVTTIIPGETPCIACLNFHNKDWKLPFPCLGTIPSIMGSMAATEAIKEITGFGTSLRNRLQIFDGKTSTWRTIKVRRNPNCPVCGCSGKHES